MESHTSNLKDWLFMEAKIAAAVAIIKSKPPGMSGRAHAQALAIRLRRQEESWRDRAQSLERELLRLRQDSLIRRMTSNTTSSSSSCIEAADASRVDDTSQDLFSPGSAVGGADLQPNRISFEPLTQDPKLNIPTPQLLPFCQTNDSHLRFLRSLCGLQQLKGNSRGQEALWFGHDGEMCSVFADTMCQLLDSVVAACRPPATVGPTDLVLQACQVAAQALDLFCSQRMPSVELLSRMEEPLRELTQMLLHSKQPSRVQECSEPDNFPLDSYLNSCQLFWMVENLLQRSRAEGRRVEAGSNLTSLLGQLEQRVFLLSDEFPLFSIYVYRIKDFFTLEKDLE
ncbi:meiosis-specific protein MEI4 isoform X2 [Oryzias latipes]|uniref:meiosis-specific protein MEI4 isoform X2 n=1 Tax=Oryzias latipes TaxID=8090 RepID=UPI000CE20BCE|nr:meiosis-specific protein MEI4 isoform X2 [Oryzias latipes]